MAANLTPKQKKFCDEYLKDLNGTQAAIRVGYSVKTANRIASQLLSKLDIQNYLNIKKEKQAERSQITKDQLVAELSKIAFSDFKNYTNGGNDILELKYLDNDKTAAISSLDVDVRDGGVISKKLRLHNKVQAIERLCKMLGYDAPDKVNLETTAQVTIFKLPDNGRG